MRHLRYLDRMLNQLDQSISEQAYQTALRLNPKMTTATGQIGWRTGGSNFKFDSNFPCVLIASRALWPASHCGDVRGSPFGRFPKSARCPPDQPSNHKC